MNKFMSERRTNSHRNPGSTGIVVRFGQSFTFRGYSFMQVFVILASNWPEKYCEMLERLFTTFYGIPKIYQHSDGSTLICGALSLPHTSPLIDLFLNKDLDPGNNSIRIQLILMPPTFMETIVVMLVTYVKALMAD